MTDEQVIELRNHLEMMRRPHLWRKYILPLKRGLDVAILVREDDSNDYAVLRNQNMLMPIPGDANWEKGGDALLVKLVKEGWEVD